MPTPRNNYSYLHDKAKVPAVEIARNPLSPVVSKFIPDEGVRHQYNRQGNRKNKIPELNALMSLSNDKVNDINDADSVMQMLPDIELSAQVLVSSILTPQDMLETELSFLPTESVCPPDVASTCIKLVKEHFSNNYKLETRLPIMLKDILFQTGSYALVVIPENAIDEVINNNQVLSSESFQNLFGSNPSHNKPYLSPKGILGSPRRDLPTSSLSLESYRPRNTSNNEAQLTISLEDLKSINPSIDNTYSLETYLEVTDNWEILSAPRLIRKAQQETIESLVRSSSPSYSTEANDHMTDRDLDKLLYRKMHYQPNTLVQIKTNDQGYRKSIGEPLVMHLPSEAVIPVFVPGSPSEHIGYFILIDENGNPLSKDSNVDHYDELARMTNTNKRCLTSSLLERGKELFKGENMFYQKRKYDYASQAYGELVEKDLIQRLRNGIYGKNVKLGGSAEIYRVMFARSLQQQRTQLLFVPVELMTYMAFKFDNNGIGYSLLDKQKIINSLSISLLLANTRAAIMNSIPRTKVSVTLDEDDPDVESRYEQIVNEVLLLRSNGNNGIPLGVVNPANIETWASQANVEFHFSGARDNPDMDVDIDEFASNIPKPDTELEDNLRRRRIMGLGLSPETIDTAESPDFATTVIENSLLMARRALQYQQLFTPLIADHVVKVSLATPSLIESISKVIENNIEDVLKYLISDSDKKIEPLSKEDKKSFSHKAAISFIRQIQISLPKPNSLSLKKKGEEFRTYVESLDEMLQYYISDYLLPPDLHGELGEKAEEIRQIIKAHFARQWAISNDYLQELSVLRQTGEKGEPEFDLYKLSADFGADIIKSIATYIDKAEPMKETSNLYAKEKSEEDEEFGMSSDYDTSGSDSQSSDSSSSDMLGEDNNSENSDIDLNESDLGSDDLFGDIDSSDADSV